MNMKSPGLLSALLVSLSLVSLVATALPAWSAPSPAFAQAASTVHAFEVDSLERIRASRRGQPFILSFWSLSCSHCPAELKALAALKRRWPTLEVVLVATDPLPSGVETALRETVQRHGLGQVEQWAFGDQPEERLRFAIDRRWYGELPRTYFYNPAHEVEAVSGVVPARQLERWAATQLSPASERRVAKPAR